MSAELLPPRVAIEDQTLDALAHQLNDICRTATLNLSYRVGEFIIQHLYAGSFQQWGDEGTGRLSYRQLAARGDLLLSPSALCKSVAIYALSERLGGRDSWKNLSASHLPEVLRLAPPEQRSLLQTVETERWTVSRLRAEVAILKPPRPRRLPRGSLQRSIQALQRCLTRHRQALLSVGEDELDPDTAAELSHATEAFKLQVIELEQMVQHYQERTGPDGRRDSFIRAVPDGRNADGGRRQAQGK